MEFSLRSLCRTLSNLACPSYCAVLGLVALSVPARAYDEFSHEWITRNSIDYLRDHSHTFSETGTWIRSMGLSRGFAEDALVRSVVDTDYRRDLWLGGWFHPVLSGAQSDGIVISFTSLFHFLNVTIPGTYWNYDGYAYYHSTQQGNDSYLSYVSVNVQGRYSTALGGKAPGRDETHEPNLGTYDLGFKGTRKDWRRLFDAAPAWDAVFPPSTVPAQIAYAVMLGSERSSSDSSDTWTEDLPLVTGLFSTTHFLRKYWRGEVAELPREWLLLGMVMHLTQDATVPQHAQGTSDNCHPEYEDWIDRANCGSTTSMDRSAYFDGSYQGPQGSCGQLYDADLVTLILSENPDLAATSELPLPERMIKTAQISAQWKWHSAPGYRSTHLPGGQEFQARECEELLSIQAVKDRARFQYNLAVAETVALFEKAAHDYEPMHPIAPWTRLLSVFDGS